VKYYIKITGSFMIECPQYKIMWKYSLDSSGTMKKDRQRINLCTKRDLTGLPFASRIRDNGIKKRAIPVSQNPPKLISLERVSPSSSGFSGSLTCELSTMKSNSHLWTCQYCILYTNVMVQWWPAASRNRRNANMLFRQASRMPDTEYTDGIMLLNGIRLLDAK